MVFTLMQSPDQLLGLLEKKGVFELFSNLILSMIHGFHS